MPFKVTRLGHPFSSKITQRKTRVTQVFNSTFSFGMFRGKIACLAKRASKVKIIKTKAGKSCPVQLR